MGHKFVTREEKDDSRLLFLTTGRQTYLTQWPQLLDLHYPTASLVQAMFQHNQTICAKGGNTNGYDVKAFGKR